MTHTVRQWRHLAAVPWVPFGWCSGVESLSAGWKNNETPWKRLQARQQPR